MEDVTFDLNAITDLIEHPNKRSVHSIHGASQVGKTTLMLQLLYDLSQKMKRPTLLYDTEGGGEEFLKHWGPVFSKKYPKARVDVRTMCPIRDILYDHGKTVKFKMSGEARKSQEAKLNTGGKIDTILIDDMDPSPMSALVAKEKYGAIAYDSVTMPSKYFGPVQQNFPARNYAQTLWFVEMLSINARHDCYIFASHHSSKNPADPYAREQMAGGSATQYISKVILYMKKWQARGATSYRTVKLARYFDKAPNEHEALIKLTADGYVDATKEQMEADKEAAKK